MGDKEPPSGRRSFGCGSDLPPTSWTFTITYLLRSMLLNKLLLVDEQHQGQELPSRGAVG